MPSLHSYIRKRNERRMPSSKRGIKIERAILVHEKSSPPKSTIRNSSLPFVQVDGDGNLGGT
jgi:hypothetical protein